MARITLQAKTIKGFELFSEGKSLGVFFQKGEWNGMLELANDVHKVIVVRPSETMALLNDIFGTSNSVDMAVVMASPNLLPIDQPVTKGERKEQSQNVVSTPVPPRPKY